MSKKDKKWELINKTLPKDTNDVVSILLNNRGIKTQKQRDIFLNPQNPINIKIESLDISLKQVQKALDRIEKAKNSGETVIVYGDYDADGITGTATMWETLHALGLKVLPHIPNRFTEGYGLNLQTVSELKEKYKDLGLIITVDHGIVAGEKVQKVKDMGIDMIITDHHQKAKSLPKPLSLIYTTQIGGSAVSWFFAKEIVNHFSIKNFSIESRLELAAIGTVADQLVLTDINRSIVKYGLLQLNKTKRLGLNAMIQEASLKKGELGTYEIGFVIAPRINSMGRLRNGIESLRLLCTKDPQKAGLIAQDISLVNKERQNIVDTVVLHSKKYYESLSQQSVIVLADESYHEGVIGLAAAKLVEEFYKPSIVLSKKGDIAKASARSINGFNIIQAIRQLESLYIEGGGHPMAAGFSIKTENIQEFSEKLNQLAKSQLTPDILERKLKIDTQINFDLLTLDLYNQINSFDPTGTGNYEPTFLTSNVQIVKSSVVGKDFKHLKVKLKQGQQQLDAIAFGFGELNSAFTADTTLNVVYTLDLNVWNGKTNLQLMVRDIKIN